MCVCVSEFVCVCLHFVSESQYKPLTADRRHSLHSLLSRQPLHAWMIKHEANRSPPDILNKFYKLILWVRLRFKLILILVIL